MAAVASRILQEQIAVAQKILSSDPVHGVVEARDIMRLAELTLELHLKLSTGTPFPAAWLSAPGRFSRPTASRKRS